ncbi:hypothetical protein Ahy_Scaffold1g107395 [Arachis hypogaea]|uniref:F-box domain-containing protein n=1 Tax=Arachis hypogaea TaxID=3818 RepID=A0A444WVN2_ARAHY|nr:hypothetical protein Ahy_Scaffold1g107395 [Arachis hypogaea]
MENQFPEMMADMGEQILSDDLLMEIFTRTDPKTAARCRTASTTWRVRLSSERFMKDNTLTNVGKYRNVLLQIGDPERYGSTQAFCIVDCVGGGRYSTNGPDLRLLLWNPLMRIARQLDDLADKLLKQAVIGYAFGYRAGTDNYYVVHMSKRHVLDRFLHCNVFNSAEGRWKHAYINDQRLTHLDEGSTFHLGKAVWVNWGGRGLTTATHVVVLDADTFILSKIRINRNLIQHVQALRVLDGIPHLVGYERSPHRGLSTIWCKIDLESMCVVPFMKRRVAGQYGVPWNPVTIIGDRMIIVRENNHKRARGANGDFLTEISLVQINLLNRHRVNAFNGEWPSDMNL